MRGRALPDGGLGVGCLREGLRLLVACRKCNTKPSAPRLGVEVCRNVC
jgi:hypothetical protein